MGFTVGRWLHDAPEKEYGGNGKRAVVKHLCFGPLETRIWYESQDGPFCREIHMIEGVQAGEWFVDPVSLPEMRSVLDTEIALCQTYGQTELADLFQAEREKLERRLTLGDEKCRNPESATGFPPRRPL